MSSDSILNTEESRVIQEFLDFVNASVTPYHAVQMMAKTLESQKFTKLDERENWDSLKPGHYYFTRNQSTIVAFSIPVKYQKGNGFTVMAGHTDSPVFRVKPRSKFSKSGSLMVGVEAYGGGLWHSWFDRDLSVAGRVVVNTNGKEEKEAFESRLVRIDRPILRISNLAIHLNRGVNDSGFQFNSESQTVPVLATEFATQSNKTLNAETKSPLNDDCHPMLLRLLAKELGVNTADCIQDFELCLYDTQKSCLGGAFNEFIYSARLDNLMSCFVCLRALLQANRAESYGNETNIRMLACFDNEEIGSNSNRGAASNLLLSTMKRLNGEKSFESAIQKSFLISSDMAHAVHPNYSDKHESQHAPQIHKGLVVKFNSNQRYSTSMATSFHIFELARKLNVPLQKFMVRNDSPCGSTIGPILATACGIRAIDVGIPQLSMHSIREVCGVKDVISATALLTSFYENFVKLDASLKID